MNIFKEISYINKQDREVRNGHKSCILWLTGLSGSGKSSIAKAMEDYLFKQGKQVIILDGDNIRMTLSDDLGFEKKDRSENVRRISHIANYFANAGFLVLVSCISPYEKDRKNARKINHQHDFYLIYIDTPIETCIKRDVKNLYKNNTKNMTGVSDAYQIPNKPDMIIKYSQEQSIEYAANCIITNLKI